MTETANPKGPPIVQSVIRLQNRRTLERLSRVGSEGATPAVLGIDAILLERLTFRGLAVRLRPLARGASYRYRISENGTAFLLPRA
jgi:hypothetical protein